MPITGKIALTKDLILSKISEEQIYKHYIGNFVVGKKRESPFHKDENPSFCLYYNENGEVRYTDFASGDNGGCIDLVMNLFNLSFYEALRKINDDFGLNSSVTGDRKEYQRVLNSLSHLPKKDTLIQVTAGRWRANELAYWNLYHLDREDLKRGNVYPVRKLFLNGEAYLLPVGELVFGYLYDDKWKVYRPLADKKHKWLTNVPLDQMSGMERITPGLKRGFVTKAKKDELILSKFLTGVCSTQNESKFALSSSNIEVLGHNCEEVFVNFDNDEVGVKASKYFNQYGFKWVNCPKEYAPIKDFADLARNHGLDTVIEYFKSKNLL